VSRLVINQAGALVRQYVLRSSFRSRAGPCYEGFRFCASLIRSCRSGRHCSTQDRL